MKECINLKYLGNSTGSTGMGGEIGVQKHSQVSVLGIFWVNGGITTKPRKSRGTAGWKRGRVF